MSFPPFDIYARSVSPDNLTSPNVATVFTVEMRVWKEEQFGPIVPIVAYEDVETPLNYVCTSIYGQQAAIFGKNCLRVILTYV